MRDVTKHEQNTIIILHGTSLSVTIFITLYENSPVLNIIPFSRFHCGPYRPITCDVMNTIHACLRVEEMCIRDRDYG